MLGIMLIFGYIYYRASLSKDKKNTSSIATKEDHFLEFTSCFNAWICMSMAAY